MPAVRGDIGMVGERLADRRALARLPRVPAGRADAERDEPAPRKLQAEVARIVNRPDFRGRHLIERGLEPIANKPEEFVRFLKEDRVLAEQIVKEAGLEPQ